MTDPVFVDTKTNVRLSFDPAKDAANQAKHGLSLSSAALFEWDGAVLWGDERHPYGEKRFIACGYIGLRLHILVFTDRDEERRIISLRKANDREIKRYAQT